MTERFLRNEMLLGPAAMEKLAGSHVCVVGLGGVGSWAAETLARAVRREQHQPAAGSGHVDGGPAQGGGDGGPGAGR